MNLKELLKIDTTKTNWYKVFDKHGINPKTIDAVSNGNLNTEKEYYYFYIENYSDLKEFVNNFLPLASFSGYLITKVYGEKETVEASLSICSWYEERYHTGYIKLLKEDIIAVNAPDGNIELPTRVNKNMFTTLMTHIIPNIIEITKEEYYNHCDIRIEDIPYGEL